MLTTKQVKTWLHNLAAKYRPTDQDRRRVTTVLDLVTTDVFDLAADLMTRGANILTVLVASAFTSIMAYTALSAPGGLPGSIGRFLAEIALQIDFYDFDVLLGAFAMANIWLIGIVIAILISLTSRDDWDMEYIEDQFAVVLADLEDIRETLRTSDMVDTYYFPESEDD